MGKRELTLFSFFLLSFKPCHDERSGLDYNITPVCDAFVRGDLNMAKYLIANGANINTTDVDNQVRLFSLVHAV